MPGHWVRGFHVWSLIYVSVHALSHVQLFAIPWTVALQAPLSMEFSRQKYWSGLPFPTAGALSKPGIKLVSLAPAVLLGGFFTLCHLGSLVSSYKPVEVVNIFTSFYQEHRYISCQSVAGPDPVFEGQMEQLAGIWGGALREQTSQVHFLSHFTPLESLMEEPGHA